MNRRGWEVGNPMVSLLSMGLFSQGDKAQWDCVIRRFQPCITGERVLSMWIRAWDSAPWCNTCANCLPLSTELWGIWVRQQSFEIPLTHWDWGIHLCISKLTTIGSYNGLVRAKPYLNQCWNIVNWTLRNKLQWIFYIEIHTFSFKKIHLKISSRKWHPFCFSLNVLTHINCNAVKLWDNLILKMWIPILVKQHFHTKMVLWFPTEILLVVCRYKMTKIICTWLLIWCLKEFIECSLGAWCPWLQCQPGLLLIRSSLIPWEWLSLMPP